MPRAISEKYRYIFDIIQANKNIPIVIEFKNKELKHLPGETITCHSDTELLSYLHRLTSMPEIEVTQVYLKLIGKENIKDLYEEDYCD